MAEETKLPVKKKTVPAMAAEWAQHLGEMLGLEGDKAKAVGTALVGSGLGALLDGKHGAVSGGALGAMLGGGGGQLGSLVSSDPVTARLLGDSVLGGVAGSQIKGVGAQGGATLGGMGSALLGMGDAPPQIDPKTGMPVDPDSAKSMQDFVKRYWPVLALGGAGMYKARENRQQPAGPMAPTDLYHRPGPSLNDLVGQQGTYTPYDGDYFTYGQAPGHDFFKADGGTIDPQAAMMAAPAPAPDGQAGPMFDSTQQSYVGAGPGSGREDQVPAHLSPNEYVIDAETVALLGDGSPDEGARKLDMLREKIRASKGKALAKGKISPDALPAAEDYLGGVV